MDVAVNPNDTEEAIWAFLSEQKLGKCVAKPLMRVCRDSRGVMRCAYALFGSSQTEIQSAKTALKRYARTPSNHLPDSQTDSLHDEFYAHLYLSLHAEAYADAATARTHMSAAVSTDYGRQSKDYMTALARVHMRMRGWDK